MPEFENIALSIENGIARIAFDRAERRNALTPDMMRECCEALDHAIAHKGVRALIVAGEGDHFSVGADYENLDRMKDMRAAAVREQIYAHFQGAVRRVARRRADRHAAGTSRARCRAALRTHGEGLPPSHHRYANSRC